MTNKETSKRILKWCQKSHDSWDLIFSWPTDGCGYNQHLRFVEYRNLNWNGGTEKEFRNFVAGYAEKLCLTEEAKKKTWFEKMLDEQKGTPLFEAEGKILELEEENCKLNRRIEELEREMQHMIDKRGRRGGKVI